ncbi:MAG: hydroxymethylbilane synthase [Pseudomonadota bacterium]
MQLDRIRIGTRGSPLALAQAHETRDRLVAAHDFDPDCIEIVVIKTSGDAIQDRPLSEVGGKGLFTKEIEEALYAHQIDLAVHSMKDLETEMPKLLEVAAVLPREDVRDAFISLHYDTLGGLPEGAVVGTSSLRRRAQLKQKRPDLNVVEFRGNVQTRLKKLADGVADATFLACAGLRRLGATDRIRSEISTDDMLPAVAQGAIAIQTRGDHDEMKAGLVPLNDQTTAERVTAERAFLNRLDGSCRTPIAGLAEPIEGGRYRFRGEVIAPDGSSALQVHREASPSDIKAAAVDAADELLSRGAASLVSGYDGAAKQPGGGL